MKYSLIFIALTLVACQPKPVVENKQPVEYQDGYNDGCPSGKAAAGHPYNRMTKDVRRFAADKLYAQGWTDGFEVCRSHYQGILRDL